MKRRETHYAPKHGRWLDIAGVELNGMTRRSLSRRAENIENARKELREWETWRNGSIVKIKGRLLTGGKNEAVIFVPDV